MTAGESGSSWKLIRRSKGPKSASRLCQPVALHVETMETAQALLDDRSACSMTSSNRSMSGGLPRKSIAPSCIALTRTNSSSTAVMNTIGQRLPAS